jgi:hypothetical protein
MLEVPLTTSNNGATALAVNSVILGVNSGDFVAGSDCGSD